MKNNIIRFEVVAKASTSFFFYISNYKNVVLILTKPLDNYDKIVYNSIRKTKETQQADDTIICLYRTFP